MKLIGNKEDLIQMWKKRLERKLEMVDTALTKQEQQFRKGEIFGLQQCLNELESLEESIETFIKLY